MMKTAIKLLTCLFTLGLTLGIASLAHAQETRGRVVSEVGFDQKLGVQLPLGLRSG